MKRGLIAWDKAELPPEAFEVRLAIARKHLAERKLPALIVYSDLWRSNHGRFFSNFMPYFNRALLVIPREGALTLLCGLSPRVYPWIKSVTILPEILPSPNLAQRLLQLCSEKSWTKIGVLDLDQVPYDLHTPICAGVETADVPSNAIRPVPDQWELAMYRRAAAMAQAILKEELPHGAGSLDHQFVGRLERRFRRAGAEDLIILLANGQTSPRPANGSVLHHEFSVTVQLEYRGHWVKLSRSRSDVSLSQLDKGRALYRDDLSGPYPCESRNALQTQPGSIFSMQIEFESGGRRLFHGDSYLHDERGLETL